MPAPEGNLNGAKALKPYESDLIAALPPEAELGPAMLAIPERWRVMVMCCLSQVGKLDRAEAAQNAGYVGDNDTLRVTAHRIWHDHRFQAAMLEQGRRALQGGVVRASKYLLDMIDDPEADAKDRLKAAGMILDRGGLPAVTETHHKDVTPLSQEQKIELATQLALRLGMAPTSLLGSMGTSAQVSQNVPREEQVITIDNQGDTNVRSKE